MGVKICGCRRPEDAVAAVEAGASHFGVVFAERLRRVTPQEAAEIVAAGAAAGAAAIPVGVFVDATEDEVRRTAERVGLRVAQLHGDEPPQSCARLRADGLGVWKALRPVGLDELLGSIAEYVEAVDAFLLEGFSPRAAGGTGTAFPHEWLGAVPADSLGRAGGMAVRDGGPPSLVLAGGLTVENVAMAIRVGRPALVDVSSGVERVPGEKDPRLIRLFVAEALEAFGGLETEGAADERKASGG